MTDYNSTDAQPKFVKKTLQQQRCKRDHLTEMLLLQDQKVLVQASFQVKRQGLPSNKPSLELMGQNTPPERDK